MSTVSHAARWFAACSLGLCSLVAQAAPPVYRIATVPSLPGEFCQATAFNDVGQVVGQCGLRGYIWSAATGSQPIADPLYPTATFFITAVNNHGVVTGNRFETWGVYAPAFVWSAASGFTYFGDSPRYWEPRAINDAGVVVGHSVLPTLPDFPWVAFQWTAGSGVRPLLPSNLSLRTLANAVNASGQVAAGFETFPDGIPHALRIEPGGGRTPILPVPRYSSARAINDAGHVGGTLQTRRGTLRAYVWTPATGVRDIDGRADLQVSSSVSDIAPDGRAVGEFTIVDAGGDTWYRPLYWDEATGMLDLLSLVDPSDPMLGQIVELPPDPVLGINAQGQVLMTVFPAGGFATSVVLTPQP